MIPATDTTIRLSSEALMLAATLFQTYEAYYFRISEQGLGQAQKDYLTGSVIPATEEFLQKNWEAERRFIKDAGTEVLEEPIVRYLPNQFSLHVSLHIAFRHLIHQVPLIPFENSMESEPFVHGHFTIRNIAGILHVMEIANIPEGPEFRCRWNLSSATTH